MGENTVRVLAVEDNPADLRLLKEQLGDASSMEFEVVGAGTLKDALQLIPSGGFSVALLDLNLPDSFGLDGIEKILATPAAPPEVRKPPAVPCEFDTRPPRAQSLPFVTAPCFHDP